MRRAPFPKDQYGAVKKELDRMGTLQGSKGDAVRSLIDFINWSGCRPSEACQILGTNQDGTECLRPPTSQEYAENNKAIAMAHIVSTKTHRPYTWVFSSSDVHLSERLQKARDWSRKSNIRITYEMLKYPW